MRSFYYGSAEDEMNNTDFPCAYDEAMDMDVYVGKTGG